MRNALMRDPHTGDVLQIPPICVDMLEGAGWAVLDGAEIFELLLKDSGLPRMKELPLGNYTQDQVVEMMKKYKIAGARRGLW